MAEQVLFEKYGRTVENGKLVFAEGDEGDQMYIIQEGMVRISKKAGGKEHVLALLHKGDFFGEMAIVNAVKRTATATAVGTVSLLAFTRQGFLNMIEKNAKIALNIIDKLCRRLQNANAQIQHLIKRDETDLVAMNLYYSFTEKMGQVLPFEKTVEELAVVLDLNETLIKNAIYELEKREIVQVLEGKSINLRDSAALEKMAENAENV